MAVHKSDQITNIDASPRVYLKPNEHGFIERRAWTFTTTAGNIAIADTIQLCKVPKDARVLGGLCSFEAMTTGAGVAGAEIGDGITSTKFKAETSVDAAGTFRFGETIAENHSLEATAEFTLTVTARTEAWAAAKKFHGYVDLLLRN